MIDPATVRAELDTIIDPCSAAAGTPAGIGELGLIRALTLTQQPDGVAVHLRIGLTEPGCLMGASFAERARERLSTLDGISSVTVELDHNPDWDPADMTPAYRQRLETTRAARRHALQTRSTATTPPNSSTQPSHTDRGALRSTRNRGAPQEAQQAGRNLKLNNGFHKKASPESSGEDGNQSVEF